MYLMQVCRQLYDLSSLTAVAFNFPTFPTDMTSMHRERISKGRIRWMVVRLYGFLWLEWSLLKSFIFGLVFFLLLVFHQLPVRTCPPIYPSIRSFIHPKLWSEEEDVLRRSCFALLHEYTSFIPDQCKTKFHLSTLISKQRS